MSKFKPLVFIALLLMSTYSKSSEFTCEDIDKLLDVQKSVLKESFIYGQPYDVGYTLAAIVWKESNAGLWKINISDPSAGVAHNHLVYALTRLGRKDTPFNRNVLAQQLVDNNQLSLHLARVELDYWRGRHKGNWAATRASYNRGNNWNTEGGKAYSEDLLQRIMVFRRCNTFENYYIR